MGKDTVYECYVSEIITELSLDWLLNRNKEKPFFLMMHHKAPHRSWMPAIKNLELFNDREFPLPDNFYDDYEDDFDPDEEYKPEILLKPVAAENGDSCWDFSGLDLSHIESWDMRAIYSDSY